MPSILVYLVRHGETEENRQHIIQGQLNTQLNETGRDQARRLAVGLRDTEFARAYSSDLTRAVDIDLLKASDWCKQTAQAVLKLHPGTPLVPQKALRERYFGALQGKVRTSRDNPPDAELLDDLVNRSLTWWDATIVPLTGAESIPGARILVVSHGGFIAGLIQGMGRKKEYDIGKAGGRILNTGITILKLEPGGSGSVLQYSNVDHLQEVKGDVVETNVDDVDIKA
ncbi:hypothetical protein FRB97_000149 [Tulasnella sp. 331]|nr:hypothetical protein FRB97_000149 [Tulasnella sp. 331]